MFRQERSALKLGTTASVLVQISDRDLDQDRSSRDGSRLLAEPGLDLDMQIFGFLACHEQIEGGEQSLGNER